MGWFSKLRSGVKYRLIQDGNNQFLVQRHAWVAFGFAEGTEWVKVDKTKVKTYKDHLQWTIWLFQATRFDDVREAVEVLVEMKSRDDKLKRSRELSVVMEE
jgi:hypothetical protein